MLFDIIDMLIATCLQGSMYIRLVSRLHQGWFHRNRAGGHTSWCLLSVGTHPLDLQKRKKLTVFLHVDPTDTIAQVKSKLADIVQQVLALRGCSCWEGLGGQ